VKLNGKEPAQSLQRRVGVSLWRQIADQIRLEISGAQGEVQLPSETVLAAQFGVNRHTVRSAIAALISEGVLRAEQGRGTFVTGRERLRYPIGKRTRFSSGLAGQAREIRTSLLSHLVEPASPVVSAGLGLAEGTEVLRLEILGTADAIPLSRATAWLDARRFEKLPGKFLQSGSITRALEALGVRDYVRGSTVIEAVHASEEDRQALGLSPGAIAIVTRSVDVDGEGKAVQYSRTRFAADRVELSVSDGV
jgi:GntR family phosphonate transport system transcriptional regulator